jgi:hypothetical protein
VTGQQLGRNASRARLAVRTSYMNDRIAVLRARQEIEKAPNALKTGLDPLADVSVEVRDGVCVVRDYPSSASCDCSLSSRARDFSARSRS